MPVVALPAVGLVLAALMAVLLLYGAQQITRFIGHLIPDWHLPGLGSIRGAVLSGVNAALSATVAVFEAASAPVANFLLLPYHLASNLIGMALNVFAAGYNAMLRLLAHANHLYNLARAAANAGEAAVLHEAQHLYNLAVARIEARFAQGLKYADAVALSTATAAVGALTTDVGKVAHAEWVAITDDVKALEGVIASDLPDIGALVRAIPRAVPLDIAGTIGGTLALERVLTRYLIDCGIPNCRNLGGLGRELADLLKLVEGAGFLAFLVAMVTDPDGTSREVNDVVAPIVVDTVNGARHLIGL